MEHGSAPARPGRVHRYQTKGSIRRRRLLVLVALAVLAGTFFSLRGLASIDPLGPAAPARPSAAATLGASRSPALAPDRMRFHRPVELEVVTHPAEATARILAADGTVHWEGPTPATVTTPGGPFRLVVEHPLRNTVTADLALAGATTLEYHLDPKGLLLRSLGRFTTGSNPKQVAFTPDGGEIWASLLGGYGVQVFDARTFAKLADIRLGEHGSVEVIFDRSGRRAYVSQMETASVYEIDTQTRTVLRRLPTGGVWTKIMALSPDERTLYAANWSSDDISEIDLETGTVLRRIPTVRTPRGLYVTPDGTRLYVAGFEHGQIARVDLASGASTELLRTGGAMRHLVGDGDFLYADDMALDKVYVVDLATDRVRELASTDEKPNTMDLTPDGRVLFVSNRGENGASYYLPGPEWGSVLAIDTRTGKVLDAIVGGNQSTGLDVSPDGDTLAFSDFLDNRVRVYAIPTYEVLVAGDGGRATAHLAEIAKKR